MTRPLNQLIGNLETSFSRLTRTRSVEGFAQLFEWAPVALVLTAIDTERVLLANHRAHELFEVDPAAARGQNVLDFWVDLSERPRVLDAIRAHEAIGELRAHLKSASGRTFHAELEAQVVTFEGVPARLVAILDRSRQFELEHQLRELAMRDSLTGVFNRRHVFVVADSEIARASRHAHPLSLALIDLDHFKRINDAHGHGMGDHVLRSFAELCRRELREIDVIGRHGGEEFVVVFAETSEHVAMQACERVRRAAEQLRFTAPDGSDVRITISVGVVEWQPGESFASMLLRADENMYAAKAAGRNAVRGNR